MARSAKAALFTKAIRIRVPREDVDLTSKYPRHFCLSHRLNIQLSDLRLTMSESWSYLITNQFFIKVLEVSLHVFIWLGMQDPLSDPAKGTRSKNGAGLPVNGVKSVWGISTFLGVP